MPEIWGKSTAAYGRYYRLLYEAKPVTCAVKGTVFDALPVPAAVVLDLFCLAEFRITQGISGSTVPVLTWMSGGVSTFIRFFGDDTIGGLGEFESRAAAEATLTGVTTSEAGLKILFEGEGKLLKIPGLPAMYDYEFCPQKPATTSPVFKILAASAKFLKEAQGIIAASPYALEEVSIDAAKSFWGNLEKEMYVVGPLLAPSPAFDATVSKSHGEIEIFLDDKLRRFGGKSISFGTAFWPTAPDYVEEVIDALLEKQFPFIFAYASPAATLSDKLVAKVNSSGVGLLSKWAPQPYILSHQATGWFLSHGGNGSIVESLSNAIPLVIWPFNADQPAAAAHLTENLKVSFELIEIRTGESGLKPLYRLGRAPKGTREAVGIEIREVIDACRGPKGVELRKNAEAVQAKLSNAWKEDGIAARDLRAFLDTYSGRD
ncbi:Hydroquinone glucosyltransferase [Psilocybe cubensis]|nr:Hydroquinone glucosyltransferase [Psilocybe cubensis]KAH9476028.1 Hydroquinone glucosyltransferase [Psilocybe cubensis]